MNRVLSVQDSGRTEAAERAALRTTRDLLIEIDRGRVVSERIQQNTRADGSTRPWFDDED